MKSKLLSMPAIAILGRYVPEPKRRTVVGSLFAVSMLPAWTFAVAAVGFFLAIRYRLHHRAPRPSLS